jgi:serine-type D-Ala-D-Ala carboxypeptidase
MRGSAEDVANGIREAGVAPSVSCGWARRANRTKNVAHSASEHPWVREVGGARQTYFDLASLTKPLTALAFACAGELRSKTLGDVLAKLASTAAGDAPLELFLAHRTGLGAHAPLYEPLTRGEDIDVGRALAIAANSLRDEVARPVTRPIEGHAPLYSDLGYILAGAALAHDARATDAGEVVASSVIAPLGLGDCLGTARELERRGVPLAVVAAPTEDVPWRGGVVRGRVHDENAWALTGAGGCGHAGLFGTIEAVLTVGEAVLDGLTGAASPFGELVDLSWLVRARPHGTLRAGFDGKSLEGSSAGTIAGPRTFGHLGFTGTSLWIDPDAEIVVALLTNRVHPTRDNIAIRAARPFAHDALFARALSAVADARSFGVP